MKNILIIAKNQILKEKVVEILYKFNLDDLMITVLSNLKQDEDKFNTFNFVYFTDFGLDDITTFTFNKDFDLIVFDSMVEDSKEDENALHTKVIRLNICPVFICKSTLFERDYLNIVFVSDFTKEYLFPFKSFLKTFRNTKAKISLIKFVSDSEMKGDADFEKLVQPYLALLDEKNKGVYLQQNSNSLEKGVNLITEIFDFDIVSFVSHGREYKSDFYEEFISERLVDKSEVSLISIPSNTYL